MNKLAKATLVAETFPHREWRIVSDEETYQLEVDFSSRGNWLSSDEEELLRLMGARNIFAVTGGWDGEPLVETGELNTAMCGCGLFCFEDDEDRETFPIPSPGELCLVG